MNFVPWLDIEKPYKNTQFVLWWKKTKVINYKHIIFICFYSVPNATSSWCISPFIQSGYGQCERLKILARRLLIGSSIFVVGKCVHINYNWALDSSTLLMQHGDCKIHYTHLLLLFVATTNIISRTLANILLDDQIVSRKCAEKKRICVLYVCVGIWNYYFFLFHAIFVVVWVCEYRTRLNIINAATVWAHKVGNGWAN